MNDDPFAEFRASKGKFIIIRLDTTTGLIDREGGAFNTIESAIAHAEAKLWDTILLEMHIYNDKGECKYKRDEYGTF